MGRSKSERLFDHVNRGNVLKVKSFLKRHRGFDVNTIPPSGTHRHRTLMHVVSAAGDDAVLRLLLKFGGNSELQDGHGDTPLHLALQRVLHGHKHAFSDLVLPIMKSCSLNVLDIPNKRGRTPRQMLQDVRQMSQPTAEDQYLGRNTDGGKEEEETEETKWHRRLQEEWADEMGGAEVWEDGGWERGRTGTGADSPDDWRERIADEYRQKRRRQQGPTAPPQSRGTRERDEREKFQRRLEEEHERYKRRSSDRLRLKLKRQKDDYTRKCGLFFNSEDDAALCFDDVPWPAHRGDADKTMQVLMCDVDRTDAGEVRKFLRSQQLMWHPDKFVQQCGARLVGNERDRILEEVTRLSQLLNQLGEDSKS